MNRTFASFAPYALFRPVRPVLPHTPFQGVLLPVFTSSAGGR